MPFNRLLDSAGRLLSWHQGVALGAQLCIHLFNHGFPEEIFVRCNVLNEVAQRHPEELRDEPEVGLFCVDVDLVDGVATAVD